MKNLISTLLFTISGFLNFGELNPAGLVRGFSSRSTPILAYDLPAGPDTEGPPHRTIPYGDRLIQLWLDRQDPTRVVKADYQGNYAPTPSYVVSNDFFVKLIDVGGFKIVGHLNLNGSLSGVRAPNPNARPNDIEPSPSKWFIIYYGRAFKVTLYAATGYVRGVSLVPQNLHKNPLNQSGMETTKVNFENVHFIIFHGPRGILGAELNPARHPRWLVPGDTTRSEQLFYVSPKLIHQSSAHTMCTNLNQFYDKPKQDIDLFVTTIDTFCNAVYEYVLYVEAQ